VLGSQIIIQILLVAAFVLFALIVIVPTKGTRHLAVRRLSMLAILGLGVLTVAFPDITTATADSVGVGRGTDLVLYVFVVVFVGNSIFNAAKFRHHERDLTKLARALAIRDAPRPWEEAER
jgi:hypothetical protein